MLMHLSRMKNIEGRQGWYSETMMGVPVVAGQSGMIIALMRWWQKRWHAVMVSGSRLQRLQLETDCQVLLNLWKHPTRQNSEIGPLLQQIDDLSRGFVEFSFSYASRLRNKLAHECARLVSRSALVEEWQIPPPCLGGIIAEDCRHVHDE